MKKSEIIVSIILIVVAIVVIYASVEANFHWTKWGPGAGFLSFYLGLISLLCAAGVLFLTIKDRNKDTKKEEKFFVNKEGLKVVVSISSLTFLYTIGIIYLGIYISSAALCFVFARWLGRHGWFSSIIFSILVPAITYFGLEKGLHLSLPKSFLYIKDVLPI